LRLRGARASLGAMSATREPDTVEATFVIATLRYFPLPSTNCMVCKGPGGVVRIGGTAQGDMMVTMLCEGCGSAEVEGLLERGDMREMPGGLLINPKYVDAVGNAVQAAADDARLRTPDRRRGGRLTTGHRPKKKAKKKPVVKKAKKKATKKATKKKASKKKAAAPKKKAKKKATKKKGGRK